MPVASELLHIFFIIHSWNSSTLSVFFSFPIINHTVCYFTSSISEWDQQTLPWNYYFKVLYLSDFFPLLFLVLSSYVLTSLYPDSLTKQNGKNPQQTPKMNKKETKPNSTKESQSAGNLCSCNKANFMKWRTLWALVPQLFRISHKTWNVCAVTSSGRIKWVPNPLQERVGKYRSKLMVCFGFV